MSAESFFTVKWSFFYMALFELKREKIFQWLCVSSKSILQNLQSKTLIVLSNKELKALLNAAFH